MSKHPPVFTDKAGNPLPKMHNLHRNPRSKYALQVTVATDPKLVGRRIIVQLRTDDPAMALQLRDVALETLKKAGVLCRQYQLIDDV